MSERASQMAALVATIDPQEITTAGGVLTGDVIDASLYDSILFIANIGSVSSCSGGLTMTVYEGTATSTVTTTLGTVAWTAANTSSGNTQIMFDLDCEKMGGPNYRYVKATLTSFANNTGTFVSMVGLGFKPRFHPGTDSDLASLITIKICT